MRWIHIRQQRFEENIGMNAYILAFAFTIEPFEEWVQGVLVCRKDDSITPAIAPYFFFREFVVVNRHRL